MDNINEKSPEEILKFAKEFNPVDDQEFFQQLYKRTETMKKVNEMMSKSEEIILPDLKFRSGLAPVTKNIRNIRFKKE